MWTRTEPEFADIKIWGCHVYTLDVDVSRTKLANHTYFGLFMKSASTTKIKLCYIPRAKKFNHTSHTYIDKLGIGTMDNIHTRTMGTKLIPQFPQFSQDVTLSDIQSNHTTLPNLREPAVVCEIYLPPVDH